MAQPLNLNDLKPVSKPSACVIGHPISHSKSPQIHQNWLSELGLEGDYHALDVAPKDLQTAIKSLQQNGYQGCNLTLPHKRQVLDFCDELSPEATAIGAANTVYFREGKVIGTNTDAYGFLQNLKSQITPHDWANGPAAIIGAGGAARAVVFSLLSAGVPSVRIINRTYERAENLAADFGAGCHAFVWESRSLSIQDCGLVVNTSSLGMSGQPNLELDLSQTDADCVIADIVYEPLMTSLLTQAKERGNPICTGYGMLLYQAQLAFEKFYGKLPEVKV